MGSMPRRARQPIPTSPAMRRRRVMAGCAVVLLLGHLLLAQLTLGLAVAFDRDRPGQPVAVVVADRAGRGRVDLGAGDRAGARGGRFRGRARAHPRLPRTAGTWPAGLGRPSGPFAGAGSWLPGQLPIALIAGAAEAALIGWLGWRRTDEQAVRPPRPGLLAAVRAPSGRLPDPRGRRGHQAGLRARGRPGHRRGGGTELARDGGRGAAGGHGGPAGDGHRPAGGARRPPPPQAADRRRRQRRQPPSSAPWPRPARPRGRRCAARAPTRISTGSSPSGRRCCCPPARPSWPHGPAPASPMLAAGLRRIGVDGDGLIWVTGGERLPKSAVAALIGDGRAAGLAVVIGTASAAAAADLTGLAATLLVHRITDPFQAVTLGQALAGVSGISPGPSAAPPGAGGAGADAGGAPPGPAGPAPRPAPSARHFAVARSGRVRAGGERAAAAAGDARAGWCRPGSRDPPVAGQERLWRRLRYDPA